MNQAGDRRIAVIADALTYAVTVALFLFVPAALYSFATGRNWVGVKHLFFFGGFALLAYASFRLRPAAAWRKGQEVGTGGTTVGNREETWFQRLTRTLPPARWYPLAPRNRLSPPTKLLLGSVLVLLISLAMEVVFGVRVRT